MRYFYACPLILLLAGCMAPGSAPISDAGKPAAPVKPVVKPAVDSARAVTPSAAVRAGEVQVRKGDTLYAIAFQNGLDYRDIAMWNNLSSPDQIQVGQILRLSAPEAVADNTKGVTTVPLKEVELPQVTKLNEPPLLTEPKAQRLPYSEANLALLQAKGQTESTPAPLAAGSNASSPPAGPLTAPTRSATAQNEFDPWRWPAEGSLIGRYGEGGGKGINLAGERHSPILAAAAGKVVYSGAGLRGYGKMVIVKHPDEFLTAYAHNQTILVKEGQWVKPGQVIAEMGDTDSDRVKLHFEIRQYGKPVDPLKILPARK